LKKTLIEEPTIELLELFDKVSKEAKIEKNAVPPLNKMVYYWTRKPLVVGRAVALASTLDNIEDVKSLLHLGRDKRAYTYTPDVNVYKKKLGRDPSEIKVLDPFGGAGNLIYESTRLELNCTSADYNPLAYLLQKSVLEYPAKYGSKLAEDFEKYFNEIVEFTKKEVEQFYGENDLTYFWMWCIKCPHCEQRVPLTNQMWIANTSKKKIGIRFHVTKDKNFTTELVENMTAEEGKQYTQKGGKAICISCKNTVDYKTLTNDIATRKDQEIIGKQISINKNRKYSLVNEEDRKLFHNAIKKFNLKIEEFEKENLIPKEVIRADNIKENRLWKYGIKNWNDYFNKRQLLFHITFLKKIRELSIKLSKNENHAAICLYIAFGLCRHINLNTYGVTWSPTFEKPAHTLSLRRPAFVFNHAEINPFGKVAGSLENVKKNILSALEFTANNQGKISILNESVTKKSDIKYDLIITDPPYSDDVQYGEQSNFFYVWLQRCVNQVFTQLPMEAPLDEDFCDCLGRFGNKELSAKFFEKGFKKSFVSLNEKLKDDGLLVVFFAHSTNEAWNILLESIALGKFQVKSSFSLHTENSQNVLARGKTSFMSSIIVVCRKLTEEKTAYFEDIIPQTEDNVKSMIDKIPPEKLLTIPITDLLIMAYGKVLETCTQFTELKSYEKDFTPDFETLISGSQDFIMRELVAKLTGRNMNLIGAEMAFCLLVRIFFRGNMAADDAIKITRAITIDLNKLQKEQMITNVGGVTNLVPLQEVKLELKPEELDGANLYQQMAHLVHLCHTQGVSKVSAVLSQSGSNLKVDELKKIIPLLIKSYRLQINKNTKLDDSELEELKILETISDIWGGTEIEGSLDKFIGK